MTQAAIPRPSGGNEPTRVREVTRTAERDYALLTVGHHLQANIGNLRRFVSVLTGHRRFANFCVIVLIEELASRPEMVLNSTSPKIALFKHMLGAMNDASSRRHLPYTPIVHVSHLARQAALLLEMEDFTEFEVSEILGISTEHLAVLQAQYKAESIQPRGARILVIEDEPLIAWQIEMLVGELGHQLLGVATTQKQAARLLVRGEPDIVLADVRLADGSTGVDTVSSIIFKKNIPVIFVTGHPEYFHIGPFEEPVFVVGKPFVPGALKVIIRQALYLSSRTSQ